MESNDRPPDNSEQLDIQFDMTRISDGEFHREIVSIPQRDFDLSVEGIRSLIETRLNIPRICQIQLRLLDIPLDCLPPDYSAFPSRIHKKGERLPINLHYYANSVTLKPVEKNIEGFEKALSEENYRIVYVTLNTLNHEQMDQNGWDSEEAMGTRIYLRDCNFLTKLLDCVYLLTHRLFDSYSQFQRHPEDSEARSILLGRADSISMALDAALAFVWNYGAKCMDRICLHRKGFLQAALNSIAAAQELLVSDSEQFRGFGKLVFSKCLGVIQGFSELRTPAIEVGYNQPFILLLRKSILTDVDYDSDPLSRVIQILIFFSVSSQTEVSLRLCSDNTYLYLLSHLSKVQPTHGYYNCEYDFLYIACLAMLNWLKTPSSHNRIPSGPVLNDLLLLLNNFLSNVTFEDILAFEDHYKFIWGTLDPFTSFFFIPKTSIIGNLWSSNPQGLYLTLCQMYFKVAFFSLDMLLKRKTSRKQLLDENLLSHLVIANWKEVGHSILTRLTMCYPEITYFPVPSLYDIAAVELVCQGKRNYTQLVHSPPLTC